MCDEHGLARVTSKSSFLAEELERRILKGYCGVLGQELIIYADIELEAQFEDEGSSEEE